jgi:hypothetical protein
MRTPESASSIASRSSASCPQKASASLAWSDQAGRLAPDLIQSQAADREAIVHQKQRLRAASIR